jgi:anti-sigma B factor antagonist
MGSLTFAVRQEAGVSVLGIAGVIDTGVAPQFEAEMKKATAGGGKFVGDCTGLEHITSAGLGVLIAMKNSIQAAGGNFVMTGVSEKIMKVFAMLNLDKLVKIYPTLAEAVKAV